MLDFYLIKDDESKPPYPEKLGLKFIGGLDYKIFENLQKKQIIDSRFDYYKDFRWETYLIKQMEEKIKEEKFKHDSDLKALLEIFRPTQTQNMGLIAYAD